MGKRAREEYESYERPIVSGLGCPKKNCSCIPYPLDKPLSECIQEEEMGEYCLNDLSCSVWFVGGRTDGFRQMQDMSFRA